MGSWAPVYTNDPNLGGGRRKGKGEGEGKAKWKKEILPPQPPSLPSPTSSPTPFDASQAGYNTHVGTNTNSPDWSPYSSFKN